MVLLLINGGTGRILLIVCLCKLMKNYINGIILNEFDFWMGKSCFYLVFFKLERSRKIFSILRVVEFFGRLV